MITVDLTFVKRLREQPPSSHEVERMVAASTPTRDWTATKIRTFLDKLREMTDGLA